MTDESADAPALVLGDASLPGLAAGTEQDVLQTVTIPYRTPDGFSADSPTARIVAMVDPDRSIDQLSTANDTLAAKAVQLKVLSQDGTTSVPVLPNSTTIAATDKGTTATTPATPAGTASNFEATTVAADAVPQATTPTTPASTPTPATTPAPTVLGPKAAAKLAAYEAHQQAVAAKRAVLVARRAAATARAHARFVARRAQMQAHALRVYHPKAGA